MSTSERSPIDLAPCSIALKGANDPLIERCLDSIDDDVSVHAVITPYDTTEGILRERNIPYTVTAYGNIAKSTEISVQEAEHDHVIVMDSDTWFAPGSIRHLREALKESPLAKGKIEFLADSAITRAIARHREPFNCQPDSVSNPGLAMRRSEVAQACRGYIFNPLIRWTEDADLNYRVQQAGLPITYVPEAIIRHDPVSLDHELRAAFLYGVGKRLSIEHTPDRQPYEEFPTIAMNALRGVLPHNMLKKGRTLGWDVAVLDSAWQIVYHAGYHAQKRTQKWTVPEARQPA